MMKIKGKYSIWTLAIAVLFLWMSGCTSDDREVFIAELESSPSVSELTVDSVLLDQNNTSNPGATIVWTPAEYGAQISVRYTVELDTNSNFGSSITAAIVTDVTSLTWTVEEVNAFALQAGLSSFEWGELNLRVTSSIGDQNDQQGVSNSISFFVFPFEAIANPLFFVGAGTAADWNNPASPLTNHYPLFPNLDNLDIYSFTGFFRNDGFKVIESPGSWDSQWGLGAADGQLSRDGGSGNLSTGAEGYFTFEMNSADLTFSIEAFDEAAAPDYTDLGIGITGEAVGGWDEFPTRFSMTQSDFDPHIWFATSVTFTDAQFKFKQDAAGWGVQWGFPTEGANNWPYDKAALDGGNLAAKAGTYTVFFNDLTGDYWMIEE